MVHEGDLKVDPFGFLKSHSTLYQLISFELSGNYELDHSSAVQQQTCNCQSYVGHGDDTNQHVFLSSYNIRPSQTLRKIATSLLNSVFS